MPLRKKCIIKEIHKGMPLTICGMGAKEAGRVPCKLSYCQQTIGLLRFAKVLKKEKLNRIVGVNGKILNEIYEHYFCATSGIVNPTKIGNVTFYPPKKGKVKVVFDNGHTYYIPLTPKRKK